MTEPTRRHVGTEWATVAVTALPRGWYNVYTVDPGDNWDGYSPCAAVLLQERRGEHIAIGDRREFRPATPPYETRAVFADHDGGELMEANATGNYVETRYRPERLTGDTP